MNLALKKIIAAVVICLTVDCLHAAQTDEKISKLLEEKSACELLVTTKLEELRKKLELDVAQRKNAHLKELSSPIVSHASKMLAPGKTIVDSLTDAECEAHFNFVKQKINNKELFDVIERGNLNDWALLEESFKAISPEDADMLGFCVGFNAASVNNKNLFSAISAGNLDGVKKVLNAENSKLFINSMGQTPLMFAAANGKLNIFKYCAEYCDGMHLEKVDNDGNTVLMAIASSGNAELLEYYFSLIMSFFAIKKYEVKQNVAAHINNHKNKMGLTPLMLAIEKGKNPKVVKRLLELGADDDCADFEGKTVLSKIMQEPAESELRRVWGAFQVKKSQQEKHESQQKEQKKQQELKHQKKADKAFEELLGFNDCQSSCAKSKSPAGGTKQGAAAQGAHKKKNQLALKKIEKEKEEKAAKERARLAIEQQLADAKAAKIQHIEKERAERQVALALYQKELVIEQAQHAARKEAEDEKLAQQHNNLRIKKTVFTQWKGNVAAIKVEKAEQKKKHAQEQELMQQKTRAEQIENLGQIEFLATWEQTLPGQLFQAIANNDISGAENLLKQGLNNQTSYMGICNPDGNTPLMVAALHNDTKMMSYLLGWGFQNIAIKNNAGETLGAIVLNKPPHIREQFINVLRGRYPQIVIELQEKLSIETAQKDAEIERLRQELAQLKKTSK